MARSGRRSSPGGQTLPGATECTSLGYRWQLTGLKGPAPHQHGGVIIDFGQVLGQVVKSPLFLEIVVVNCPQGVVPVSLIGFEVAVEVQPLLFGDGACS